MTNSEEESAQRTPGADGALDAQPAQDTDRVQFIPPQYHYHMLQDEGRMVGFRTALGAVVPAGGRVVELGGGTGALSFFAAERAGRVWCVEAQPELARLARRLLESNGCGGKVTVVEGDANEYLPPEPVDVVICELLHSALLCEQQLPVLLSFRERYLAAFGPPLPRFVPEATVLGVAPVEQDYDFSGFRAPVPIFQSPGDSARTRELGSAVPYAIVQYSTVADRRLSFDGLLQMKSDGRLNALRFSTNNALAVLEEEGRTINWPGQNLVLPIAAPLSVRAGQAVRVTFSYAAGSEISALQASLKVSFAG